MKIIECTPNRLLFLLFGLWKRYDLGNNSGQLHTIIESEGVRIARRNNFALAGIVVAAFLAGANPQDIEIFGASGNGTRGVITVCLMIIVCHVYWYFMRWHHLFEHDRIQTAAAPLEHPGLPFSGEDQIIYHQKSAALYANRACFVLVLLSTCFSVWWGFSTILDGIT